MKVRGLTDVDDYHWRTLLWCLRHGGSDAGWDWRDWRLEWTYIWYDGPNWYLHIGPAWMRLSA